MLNKTKTLSVYCVVFLSSCAMPYESRNSASYQYSSDTTTQLYAEGLEGGGYYTDSYQENPVVVPESYHVGVNHSPAPHTDRDKTWVNSQNSQSYTIELADSEKAYEVANTLYKAPKSERMAEVQYQKDGKAYYKGVYGSYPNYEAAETALKSLPDSIKQKAGVKTWGSVQSSTNQ